MYNFGIASTLKTWFDYVPRTGVTFKYSESGPAGLLEGKRAIVVESRDGLYSEAPAKAMDSQEPDLRNLLGFMGIHNERRSWPLAVRRVKWLSMWRAQLEDVIQKDLPRVAY
jgi:FMN-dependent NADH-azoreductase